MTKLPRLELTEDPNKNNEFIIFRNQIKNKSSVRKKRRYRKNKTRKHKKSKSLFNIF